MSRRTRKPRAAEPRGGVRLQKLIADAGLASRREAEAWIAAGRVRLNGEIVREQGVRADLRRDRIEVNGRVLGRPPPRRSYLVHKPRGVVTTTRDPHAKRTVLDLVKTKDRLFPVGRLDAASEGLLLLTNDGAAAHVLLHPSFEVERTYRVSIDGAIRAEGLRLLSQGVELDGEVVSVSDVRLLEREDKRSVIEVDLREGRRHQIRRMLVAAGHPVRRLLRTRFGPLRLGRLGAGDSRPLDATERKALDRMLAEAERGRRPAGTTQRRPTTTRT